MFYFNCFKLSANIFSLGSRTFYSSNNHDLLMVMFQVAAFVAIQIHFLHKIPFLKELCIHNHLPIQRYSFSFLLSNLCIQMITVLKSNSADYIHTGIFAQRRLLFNQIDKCGLSSLRTIYSSLKIPRVYNFPSAITIISGSFDFTCFFKILYIILRSAY